MKADRWVDLSLVIGINKYPLAYRYEASLHFDPQSLYEIILVTLYNPWKTENPNLYPATTYNLEEFFKWITRVMFSSS